MKTLDLKQLDEKEEEIANALISLGMSRNAARMLVYLQNVAETTSVELEKVTGMHQPAVSIAARELKERGWINEREEKKHSKGRPYKIFSLKICFSEIVAQLELEEHQKKAVNEAQTVRKSIPVIYDDKSNHIRGKIMRHTAS